MQRTAFRRSVQALALITLACGQTPSATPSIARELLTAEDLGFARPDPEPHRLDVDPFEPPAISLAPSGPAIAEGLVTAEPDEFIPLAGPDFLRGASVQIFGQAGSDPPTLVTVKPIGVTPASAAVLLPKSLPPSSMYLIWPTLDGRSGRPFAVNRTESWWAGPKFAVAGRTLSIFGRNLTASGGRKPLVYLKPAGPAPGEWLPVLAENPYKLDVLVPPTAGGRYEIWTHNRRGGRFGRSGPIDISVRAASAWDDPSGPVLDVTQFGAAGDGVRDDGAAIDLALAAAKARSPATVYFPPGVYASRRALEVPSGVRWLGEGPGKSVLRLAAPLAGLQAQGFLHAATERRDVTFERLSIEADGRIDDQSYALIALSGARVRLSDVRLSSWGAQTLRMTVEGLFIDSSDVTGSGSFLSTSSQVFVDRTTFRMTNDGEAALTSWGGRDLAFTRNVLLNADEQRRDGFGIGRLFVAQGHFGSSRNTYFGANETRDSAPRDCAAVDCNKGEQILWEFGAMQLAPAPSEIMPAAIRFASLEPGTLAGGVDVVVVGGRGAGQRRRVVSFKDGVFGLDRPWRVTPDVSTSLFAVTPIAERGVVYQNRFEGRAQHSDRDSNSTAALVWGLCYDIVIDDNDVSRMRHGLMVAATSGLRSHSVSAPFFILVANNRIRDGANGLYAGLTFGHDTDPRVVGALGAVFRHNSLSALSHVGIGVDTWDSVGGDMLSPVFERNRVAQAPYGMASGAQLIWSRNLFKPTSPRGSRVQGGVLHRNSFDRGPPSRRPSIGFRSDARQDWSLIDNVWRGFETPMNRR